MTLAALEIVRQPDPPAPATSTGTDSIADDLRQPSESDLSLMAFDLARERTTSTKNDSTDLKEKASDVLFAEAIWLDN